MPLVDYDSSDDGSDNDVEEDHQEETKIKEKPRLTAVETKTPSNVSADNSNTSLFSALPKPRKSFNFLADDNKLSKLLLNKKINLSSQKTDKESVKISIPSVADLKEDDQPTAKKLKPNVKGVGLFSILPPPKNVSVKEPNRTFVPNSVAKSQPKQIAKKEMSPVPQLKTTDEDDDTPIGDSFFGSSLSEGSANISTESIKTNENVVYEPTPNMEVKNMFNWDHGVHEQGPSHSNAVENSYFNDTLPAKEFVPVENNPLELDEKALQILCGGKKKRQQMPMNIIDLSGEEIMPDSKEWLIKQLTEEKKVKSHSHRKSDGPSTQSRRKHQITYLAFQAKEQELELQNQWANNRMSRKQTQSKYGF